MLASGRARLTPHRTVSMSGSSAPYLTLSEVAARTGRHPELLRQWCAAGRIPCHRLGGTWVIREADVALIDQMASRSRRRPQAATPSGRTRLVAAVFDAEERGSAAAEALRNRLGIDGDGVQSGPLGIEALGASGLTVVASRVPEERLLDARRIVSSFGGRVVAELEDEGSRPNPPRGRRRRAHAES